PDPYRRRPVRVGAITAMTILAFVVILLAVFGGDERDADDLRRQYLDDVRRAVPGLTTATELDLLSYGNATCAAFEQGWSDEQVYVWLADVPADYLGVDPERLAFRMVDAAREYLCIQVA
ncbi:MAG: DUF732 domain-containing protein, partial [Acidimicrobiales bacterium]